jgi:hypothetical protein
MQYYMADLDYIGGGDSSRHISRDRSLGIDLFPQTANGTSKGLAYHAPFIHGNHLLHA